MIDAPVETLGFEIVPEVLDRDECASLGVVLESVPRTRAGARHLMSITAVCDLAKDPRLVRIAQRFIGPNPFPFRATLFDKSPEANWLVVWHQDTALPLRRRLDEPGWGPWSTKAGILYAHAPAPALERVIALRVHIDASTADNGPLRVIPRSHCMGVLGDDRLLALASDHRTRNCLVPRGGVLAMRPLIAHASSKSTSDSPRRVIHIEYADAPSLGPGRELAIA